MYTLSQSLRSSESRYFILLYLVQVTEVELIIELTAFLVT